MKVIVLYRPNSEYGRVTEEFIRDLKRRSSDIRLEILNIDSREGSSTASIYDVMSYPAILVLANDGYLQKSWEGPSFPLIDEISAYAYA